MFVSYHRTLWSQYLRNSWSFSLLQVDHFNASTPPGRTADIIYAPAGHGLLSPSWARPKLQKQKKRDKFWGPAGGGGGGGVHFGRLNFKTSRVGVYKCLWGNLVPRAFPLKIGWREKPWGRGCEEVVSCCDFILRAVASFWAMSLVGIYPGRASILINWSEQDLFGIYDILKVSI